MLSPLAETAAQEDRSSRRPQAPAARAGAIAARQVSLVPEAGPTRRSTSRPTWTMRAAGRPPSRLQAA